MKLKGQLCTWVLANALVDGWLRDRVSMDSAALEKVEEIVGEWLIKRIVVNDQFWEERFKSQALLDEAALINLYGVC